MRSEATYAAAKQKRLERLAVCRRPPTAVAFMTRLARDVVEDRSEPLGGVELDLEIHVADFVQREMLLRQVGGGK